MPPDPNDQVAIIDGNSSGIIIDAIDDRYAPARRHPGGRLLGHGLPIPDFTYTVPSTRPINTNQNRNGAVTMSVTKNNAFTGTVTTSAFKDWGDAANPTGHHARRR